MYSRITACCLLGLFLRADALVAQSLGALAQQEEERRKAIKTPAKVITDKDLRPLPAGSSPDTKPAPAPSSPSPVDRATGPDDNRVSVTAAQYRAGPLPQIPVQAVSGGEVVLELTVSSMGGVAAVRVLRETPPFTDMLSAAVRAWQFRPAEDGAMPKPGEMIDPKTIRPVESKVLVAAMFRPPALFTSTLGDPPRDVAASSDEIPFPLTLAMPLYPPLAVADGVVLAELRVGADGRLVDTVVVRSAPGFDQPALDATRRWEFRAARVHGVAVPRFAYVVMGFRSPVVPPGSTPVTPSNQQGTNPNRP